MKPLANAACLLLLTATVVMRPVVRDSQANSEYAAPVRRRFGQLGFRAGRVFGM
jgi:hypothetical protein